MSNFKAELHKIKALAFDVDGVMTNSMVMMYKDGDLFRQFNSKDGFAIRYAVSVGFPIAIITGGSSETIIKRYNQLGVTDIYLRSRYKLPDFNDFCAKYGLQRNDVLFMGDDIPDIDVMQVCGMPTCPADAVPEVKRIAQYISNYNGGDGCVRDIIEQVLKVHGKWGDNLHIPSI
ncbi:MAG: HAD hydrolase family protein [Prevotellaceae bacterium]|jgi:3-deoxy-D-manno-octulosonate 8-phosphate phosphatase (KDO 8-P phosphatase)|nr:HAD hydrolase family protein [Prevotellaceae bacterium]